ncbi:organic cation transporter protein-like isoform X2 [Pomacea canaliculata]|uniref:organic cation transporter protein-like isoform X2 n=1 Tax=Pomacea canaliculata TaxID=400727 RepID=UPI000D729E1A|nr:organic cation transporter protein-like isoform X2 [Pomacea canaliculata]
MNSRYRYAVAVTVVSLCCRLLDITRLRVDVMHLDDALKMLGEFGWYQRVHLLLVCGFAILCAWHGLNMVFLGAVPHFHCSLSDVNATWYGVNQSQLKDLLIPEGEGCKRYSVNSSLHRLTSVQWVNADVTNGTAAQEACPAGYVFSTDEYDSTITSEFKLVCTKKFLQSISKCVFFAGRFLGAAVFGQLSDRFGRRPMFFVGVAMMMLTGGVAAAAPNVFVFLSMYLLQGAASTGAFVISYILIMELVGPKYRVFAGFVILIFCSLGYVSLAGIAYFIRNWRYLELAITAPSLLFLFYWWLLPESLRWLLSHDKTEEARRVLQTVARRNGKALPEDVVKSLQDDPNLKATRTYTVLDCVRTRRMACLSLNVWFNWLVNSLVYYGLSLNTENLAGSPYLNFCLVGAVEIPAYALCILIVNRVGRRKPLIVTMVVSGVASVVAGLIPTTSSTKFGISASYGTIYLASAEIFPTVVRNIGMGVSSMSARIGDILAPLILESTNIAPFLPMMLFGGLSMLGAALAFLLPETSGRPLPQFLEDVDYGNNCMACCKSRTTSKGNDSLSIPRKENELGVFSICSLPEQDKTVV